MKIKSCVISHRADDWFISFKEEFTPIKTENQGRVGVDLGIKKLATCSNGMVFESPKKFKRLERRLRREQKALSRKFESWKNLKDKSAPKFGKYSGLTIEQIADCDMDYLLWLCTNEKTNAATRDAIMGLPAFIVYLEVKVADSIWAEITAPQGGHYWHCVVN